MRGERKQQTSMMVVGSLDQRIPLNHPLRRVKRLADGALEELSPTFDRMYAKQGRPSVPPERLLKGLLLMALYTIRSERMFCEQLEYNLLFRWFLDLELDEAAFDHSTFSRNRDRLLAHEVAGEFFHAVVGQARKRGLMSAEHFTVDGTLIEAWASLKSLRGVEESAEDREPPDDPGNPTVDFRGQRRRNATHRSMTDPEARLARKGSGKEARLSYAQHALMENRHGLLVDLRISEANGTAEREVALEMLEALPGQHLCTVAGDKLYDSRAFVERSRDLNVTPHVAQNTTHRRSAIDRRTTRHSGYRTSQRIRKRVEEIFGWTKTVGNFRRTRYRGRERTQLASYLVGTAYNLLRISRLLEQPV